MSGVSLYNVSQIETISVSVVTDFLFSDKTKILINNSMQMHNATYNNTLYVKLPGV